jgi:hypothetical protein
VQIPWWGNFYDSLDLDGVQSDVMLGDDETEASSSDTKHTLEGFQADIVL